MSGVAELLKSLGVPFLNVATLILLVAVVRLVDKLRKMPTEPLSKAEFRKWKDLIEKSQSLWVERCRILWEREGVSNQRQERVVERIVETKIGYSEQISEQTPARFRTGENPIYIPATPKPPPPRMSESGRHRPMLPIAREDAPDSNDSTPTDPQGRRRK